MRDLTDYDPTDNKITGRIIAAAIEVHRAFGPGMLESVYEECLVWELGQAGLKVQRQFALPLVYKGNKLDHALRIDLIVEGQVILELKTVEEINPVHRAQIISYLKLTGLPIGLIINFKVPLLREGVERFVN